MLKLSTKLKKNFNLLLLFVLPEFPWVIEFYTVYRKVQKMKENDGQYNAMDIVFSLLVQVL